MPHDLLDLVVIGGCWLAAVVAASVFALSLCVARDKPSPLARPTEED